MNLDIIGSPYGVFFGGEKKAGNQNRISSFFFLFLNTLDSCFFLL